jgi:hypothetical protein
VRSYSASPPPTAAYLPHTAYRIPYGYWDAGCPTLLQPLLHAAAEGLKKNIAKVVSGLVAPAHGNPRIYWRDISLFE